MNIYNYCFTIKSALDDVECIAMNELLYSLIY